MSDDNLIPLSQAILDANHNVKVLTPEFDAFIKDALGDEHFLVVAYAKNGQSSVFFPADAQINTGVTGSLTLTLNHPGQNFVHSVSHISNGLPKCPIIGGIPHCPCP